MKIINNQLDINLEHSDQEQPKLVLTEFKR